VEILPTLSDNYAYLIWEDGASGAAVVDPGEAEPVAAALERRGLALTHILCTHHHADHTAGIEDLRRRWPEAEVLASEVDAPRVGGVTAQVRPGQVVEVGGLRGVVVDVSCHTRGHVAFLFGEDLFCGDALFLAGCGRFFEGDAEDMMRSIERLLALPPTTRLHCGHEYSLANLAFAAAIEPHNPDVAAKRAWAEARRAVGAPTIPSTLGEERAYNPFLRWDAPAIQAATGERDPTRVLAQVRALRSAFKQASR
jgi:hydroxyacylglutathione hydrolase